MLCHLYFRVIHTSVENTCRGKLLFLVRNPHDCSFQIVFASTEQLALLNCCVDVFVRCCEFYFNVVLRRDVQELSFIRSIIFKLRGKAHIKPSSYLQTRLVCCSIYIFTHVKPPEVISSSPGKSSPRCFQEDVKENCIWQHSLQLY